METALLQAIGILPLPPQAHAAVDGRTGTGL